MPRSRSAALAAAGAIAMALLAGLPVAGASAVPVTRPEAPVPQPSVTGPPESTLPELTDASPLDEGIAVPPGAPFPSRIGAGLRDAPAPARPAGATRGLPSFAD
jgi:hypothetical protein